MAAMPPPPGAVMGMPPHASQAAALNARGTDFVREFERGGGPMQPGPGWAAEFEADGGGPAAVQQRQQQHMEAAFADAQQRAHMQQQRHMDAAFAEAQMMQRQGQPLPPPGMEASWARGPQGN